MKRCIKCNGMIFEEVDKSVTTGVNDKMCNCPTPSDKTELKPCPFCGTDVVFGYGKGYVFASCPECLAGNGLAMETWKGQKEDAIEHWNTRSEPSKPTSEPMYKEELMKSPNPLPSSPTDKCGDQPIKSPAYKAFCEWHEKEFGNKKINHDSTLCQREWEVWQASRKECEEELKNYRQNTAIQLGSQRGVIENLESRIRELQVENEQLKQDIAFHQAERVKASSKGRNAVNISVEHIKGNARLKEETKQWRQHYHDEAKRRCKLQEHIASLQQELPSVFFKDGRLLDYGLEGLLFAKINIDDIAAVNEHIASWQSVVEKKNKLLGWAIENIKYPNHNPAPYIQWYESTQSSLHIDQSGGKKDE